MTKNFHTAIFFAVLILGLALPMLGFSQDSPKRVTVVVTAKEIAPQKEIIQLPADNTPKMISSALPKRNRHIKKAEIKIAENKIEAPKKLPTPKVERTTRAQATEKPVIAKSSPIIKTQEKTAKPIDNSANQELTTTQASAPQADATDSISPADISISRTVQQIGEKTITTIKAKKDNKELASFTHSSKVNSISYIWIGCFLIIAGVVLGLLFGKPAFLISFVGVVFITLGLLI